MSLTPFAFVDGALDRADQLRDDTDALNALWAAAGVIVLDADGRAFANADKSACIVLGAELGGGPGTTTFLGLRDGQAWFFANAATLAIEAPHRVDLRSAAAHWPAWQASLFAQARALQHWHQRHRHCGICGAAIEFRRAGWLGVCSGCNSEHYPRTDQAVIVAVGNGDRLLLGRQAGWPPRRWSVVAGFVEPGETLEQTVAREVLEETGVRVRAGTARYLASPVAGDELEQARWFGVEEVRAGLASDWTRADAEGEGIVLSSPISIARHVIRAWLAEHDGRNASK